MENWGWRRRNGLLLEPTNIGDANDSPEGTTGNSPATTWLVSERMEMRPGGTQEQPMPSTHLSLHYHIVFSTEERQPWIDAAWRSRLHEYLGGLIRAADGIPEIIGGTADHVHILVGLKATHTLSSFVQDIKQTSSRWVHETIGEKDFAWQQGYGAFTVSVSNVEGVKEYIANQEEHHRKKSFQEEYVAFLQRHRVEYDENYLW